MQSPKLLLFISGLALACSSVGAQTAVTLPSSPVIKTGLGIDYSRGDYGFASDTEVLSTSANFSAETPRWVLRAAIPYVTVKGPANVVSGSGPVFAAPARPTRSYQGGLGDILASATFHAKPSADELNVDLTGRVKFGTADEAKGLGTGETDFFAQTDFYRRFGKITPFATLGYQFLGDTAAYVLEDGPYATVGSTFRVAEATVLGAAFDWRSRLVQNGKDASDTLLFVSHNPNDRWNVMGYVLKGFTDASPDLGIGGMFTYRF